MLHSLYIYLYVLELIFNFVNMQYVKGLTIKNYSLAF